MTSVFAARTDNTTDLDISHLKEDNDQTAPTDLFTITGAAGPEKYADRAGAPSPPAPLPQGERGECEKKTMKKAGLSGNLSPLSPRGRGAGGEGQAGDRCPRILYVTEPSKRHT